MKKIYLLLAFIALTSLSNAQRYGFTLKTEEYVEFEGQTVSGAEWDNEAFTLAMPFAFSVFDLTADSVAMADVLYRYTSNGLVVGDFLGFSADLTSRGFFESPISIELEGTSPNQILKMQYKNAGFVNDGTLEDYVNYQIWMYETTNVLEVHFGGSSVKNAASWGGETGPRVEIEKEDFSAGIGLKGDPNNPTIVLDKDLLNEFEVLNGMPDSGVVYVFTPRQHPLSVQPYTNENIRIKAYPNPVSDELTVEMDGNGSLEMVNTLGEVVYTAMFNQEAVIDTKSYKQGVYFVKIRTAEGIVTKKIIKD